MCIKVSIRKIHLGYFDDEQEAARKYDEAAKNTSTFLVRYSLLVRLRLKTVSKKRN